MPVSLSVLAAQLGAELHLHPADPGSVDPTIQDVASVERADPTELAYIEGDKHLERLAGCRAAAVIVGRDLLAKARTRFAGPLLTVRSAHEAFIDAMLQLRPARPRSTCGVSPQAAVASTAEIGPGTNIHPLAVVQDRARIGRNCEIHPGAVIGEDCVIGDHTVMHPGAVLYAGVRVGSRVIIHANAVIGADGFGYRFVEGRYVKIPHTGTVIIDDDVEIGAATTIDRGMVEATVIGQGTKLDNLVMIAHNCELGRHNAFASQVGLAGSVTTGDYVRCGGQAGVANHLHLGEGCTAGPKAGVVQDIPAGEKHHGAPALPDKEQIRMLLSLQKLPEMRKELQRLMKQVAALEQALPTHKETAAA
jgi:UDP-3-O-[3-hydroxymyristoyl] glucosamine N-acyltransferase